MSLKAGYSFIFKRSNELSLQEQQQLRALFDRVFEKEFTREQFDRKYLCTPLGYSHHGLMVSEGRIVGAYNLVPYRYNYFGTRKLFGLSVDAMIDEGHRAGPFNLVKMAKLAYDGAVRDEVVFVFGFPNDNAYMFTKKILRWNNLGELTFYVLPINVGALHQSLRWANPLSRLFAAGFLRLPRSFAIKPTEFAVEKVCDGPYRRHRYDERHCVVALKGGGHCAYRICEEEDGIRALYIMDVTPLTADRLARAVRRVRDITASRVDLLLYVGRLPFSPWGLLRVPSARCPRRIRMCGKILNPARIDDRVFTMANWNVNISNFDVR